MAKRGIDQTSDELFALHELGLDRSAREIHLMGEQSQANETQDEPGVEYVMAARFIKNLRVLCLDNKKPILIHMKTGGGDVVEGLAIFDAIRLCQRKTTILCHTHASSMSSYILQAATRRIMMPNSYFMFHWGTIGIDDRVEAIRSYLEFFEKQDQTFFDIYTERMQRSGKFSSKPRKWIESMLREKMHNKLDVFLDAKETVEWGLADGVFDGDWDGLKSH